MYLDKKYDAVYFWRIILNEKLRVLEIHDKDDVFKENKHRTFSDAVVNIFANITLDIQVDKFVELKLPKKRH